MRRIVIGASLALGLTLASASTECSFSGQDQSDDVEENGPNGEGNDDVATVPGKGTSTNPSGVRVQNWGQYVVLNGGGKGSGVPGQACRGNLEEG